MKTTNTDKALWEALDRVDIHGVTRNRCTVQVFARIDNYEAELTRYRGGRLEFYMIDSDGLAQFVCYPDELHGKDLLKRLESIFAVATAENVSANDIAA